MPKPPKPGEWPIVGRYRDEDDTKADLRASQAREEEAALKKKWTDLHQKKQKKCGSSEEEEDT